MLILAKLAGILMMVWFYFGGKAQGENAVKWAILGLIGYWLTWWISNKLIIATLVGFFAKSKSMIFLITQLPIVCAVFVAFFIRKKLINDAKKKGLE